LKKVSGIVMHSDAQHSSPTLAIAVSIRADPNRAAHIAPTA
jgi:hypothetical protein